ncbi:MAG: hypothetical protein KJ852_16390 [Gammaproteobacteria bacterium]|nr:hypothetical protein [Gammaproteobacteria bacterium]MBU0786801.1 hypothetical protein [Gammaproteobacteria bacterium]MBU0813993.1 hypothetical protein [Gammaproteobacteria bacterium]MBU1788534.1 hypothetical protein [Gammaproteobacteria bacterium]
MQALPRITQESALFPDFNGSLAELAARPETVRVVVVQRLSGPGLKVGNNGPSPAQSRCDRVQALRKWLHRSVEHINAAAAARKHA